MKTRSQTGNAAGEGNEDTQDQVLAAISPQSSRIKKPTTPLTKRHASKANVVSIKQEPIGGSVLDVATSIPVEHKRFDDSDIEITDAPDINLEYDAKEEDHFDHMSINSDAYSDEDPEDCFVAYDPSQEPLPSCPIFDPQIELVKTKLLQIPKKVLSLLSDDISCGRHVAAQCDAASKLLAIPESSPPRIALLGNAGVGKSSLLNSLTDIDNLAKAVSSGKSCTSVPSEYRNPFKDQGLDFAAKIRYFAIDKVAQLLKEMLEHYFVHHFEEHEYLDEELRVLYQSRAQNAFENLRVLFCDQDDFRDIEKSAEFLYRAWEDSDAAVTQLVEIIQSKLNHKIKTPQGYEEYVEATTQETLSQAIDPLVGGQTIVGKSALWPIAESIVIGVRGSRVLHHVTVIDLPGLSDTNTIRCEQVIRYITTCGHLWIVSPIKRIINDSSVSNLLSRYAKVFDNNVTVVCTFIDEGIDTPLARHLRDSGINVDEFFILHEQLKKKNKEMTRAKAQNGALLRRKKQTPEVMWQTISSFTRIRRLKREAFALKQRRFEFLVTVRTSEVTKKLQEVMQEHLPSNTMLSVASISNLHYAYLKGAGESSGARLGAELTGIPGLRAQCLRLAAAPLLSTFTQFAQNQMASFLKSAEMWTEITDVTQRQALLEIVERPKWLLPKQIAENKERFEVMTDNTMGDTLRNEYGRIQQIACDVLQKKKAKHHATIRAFLRNNGNYQTKICASEDWNEDFSRAIIDLVKEHGEKWRSSYNSVFGELKIAVQESFKQVIDDLNKHASANMVPMAHFKDLVDIKVTAIETVFADEEEHFAQALRSEYLDLTQDSEQNHFSQTMRPVYRVCQDDQGSGVTDRCMNLLQTHLSKKLKDSPFAKAGEAAVRSLKMCGHKHLSQIISSRLLMILDETHEAFDMMIDKAKENPREKIARKRLKKCLKPLQAQLKEAQGNLATLIAKHG